MNFTYYEEYSDGVGYSITSDYNSNILIAGWFWGSKLIFGNDTLINQDPDNWNAFTCKFDSLGNQLINTNT